MPPLPPPDLLPFGQSLLQWTEPSPQRLQASWQGSVQADVRWRAKPFPATYGGGPKCEGEARTGQCKVKPDVARDAIKVQGWVPTGAKTDAAVDTEP